MQYNPPATLVPAETRRPAAASWLVPLGAVACLWPGVPSIAALLAGAALGLAGANPWTDRTRKVAHKTLQLSVVGLGAGMNLALVAKAGLHGLTITVLTITATMFLGRWLGRRMKVPDDTALLVSAGTAICGGSAIAALTGVLKPKSHDVAVALVTVFLLNGVALAIFPPIGHAMGLDQTQFGWWAALAIHDTSSVVGAGLAYGAGALAVATVVKLARALWIAPLTLIIAHSRRGKAAGGKGAVFPWFIVGFLAVSALSTALPSWSGAEHDVTRVSQRVLVATLFLIGAGFTRQALKSVGLRPFALGLTLWIIVGTVSLALVKASLIF